MGNRTRKQHNQGKRVKSLGDLVAESKPAPELEFPFHEVDQATMIFGSNIPGYRDVIAAIPEEFKSRRNRWCDLANNIFFRGADTASWKFRQPALKTKQLAYLQTWLGSFEPRHEDKESVCGWLLSLMLEEYPQ